ncbi:MAG: hypothetical protein G3M78_03920 [Candidatus Nitrohelix vancouverensis]|uniref:DZANK-type domain-containing protein n=1 Tax=Candidatus Nitrohelix vancouverensis TaxID=2705534 RepID=A0A7T0C132_9BACT|nr:MAG: hypothetical protein G3M78_03920 [Candidatus Nitrohelix vancouverensis]
MKVIECSSCNKRIIDVLKKCPHCGAGGAESIVETSGKLVNCIDCGTKIQDSSMNCPSCGCKNPLGLGLFQRRIGMLTLLAAIVGLYFLIIFVEYISNLP